MAQIRSTITPKNITDEGFTLCFQDWAYLGYVKDLTYVSVDDWNEYKVTGRVYTEKREDDEFPFQDLEPVKTVQLYTVEDLKKFLADG